MVKFDDSFSEEEKLRKLEELKKKKELEEAEKMIQEALGQLEKTKEDEAEEEDKEEKKPKPQVTLEETVEQEKVKEEEEHKQAEYKLKPMDVLYKVATGDTVERLRELTYQSTPWSRRDVEDYNEIKSGINVVAESLEEKYVRTVGQETMDKFSEARKVLKELGYKR